MVDVEKGDEPVFLEGGETEEEEMPGEGAVEELVVVFGLGGQDFVAIFKDEVIIGLIEVVDFPVLPDSFVWG